MPSWDNVKGVLQELMAEENILDVEGLIKFLQSSIKSCACDNTCPSFLRAINWLISEDAVPDNSAPHYYPGNLHCEALLASLSWFGNELAGNSHQQTIFHDICQVCSCCISMHISPVV